jgi:hypothetical protein
VICGELVEAGGLAVVLWQAATTLLVGDPEIGLCGCISLVCGELVKADGLTVVLRGKQVIDKLDEPRIAGRWPGLLTPSLSSRWAKKRLRTAGPGWEENLHVEIRRHHN